MDYIKGMTFAPFAGKGTFERAESFRSLDTLKEATGADFIILVPNGLQDTPQSEEIDYTSPATMSDDELIHMIEYIHSLGMRAAIKPTVNCKNGTWRAHINFFDKDVPCEPKWSCWFRSYTEFQLHYAEIAEKTGCEMFIAGCEMVMSERRSEQWRKLIADIKSVYSGPVSYNTDKYQEDNIDWWDCVDVISSSGYYPIDNWEEQLDRIEAVVKKYNKPFFFAEAGCMSAKGSAAVPNDWSIRGEVCLEEQAEWYRTMMSACAKRSWCGGMAFWSWTARLNNAAAYKHDGSYEIYGKPAADAVKEYYGSIKAE